MKKFVFNNLVFNNGDRPFGVGDLLNDKNALMNYIYSKDGARMGVVVGMKGKDRDNPLVGWCLFKEIEYYKSEEFALLKDVDRFRDTLKLIETAIDTSDFLSVEGRERFEQIKNMCVVITPEGYSKSTLIKAVEKALARANHNRDNFFVNTNPIHGQSKSVLKVSPKHICYITIDDGERAEMIYDEYTLTQVRRASRAMEYRCWRYFKDNN